VLFLLATLLSAQDVVAGAAATDVYLTAVGIGLTAVYVTGLLFRPTRRIAGMGVDSLVVLGLYLASIAGLVAIGG
jgi:cation:H+ antiporter